MKAKPTEMGLSQRNKQNANQKILKYPEIITANIPGLIKRINRNIKIFYKPYVLITLMIPFFTVLEAIQANHITALTLQ